VSCPVRNSDYQKQNCFRYVDFTYWRRELHAVKFLLISVSALMVAVSCWTHLLIASVSYLHVDTPGVQVESVLSCSVPCQNSCLCHGPRYPCSSSIG
jgi:hypothetical protein